jgi:cobalt-zinc-cadmium resistance protein CzcA
VEDVNHTLQASFSGAPAGIVFQDGRRTDLVLRLHESDRSNLEDVRNLLVKTPTGRQIALRNVAEVNLKVGPNQIQHENAQRRITIGFNVRGKDVQSVVTELQAKAEKQLLLPDGYYVTYGGTFENLNAAKLRLAIAVPVAMGLIFLLLYFAFGSIKHGLLIFSAIPLSAIGGIFALLLRDMPFSISAGVGFIALFGVAVLNGIVLLAEFNQRKKEGEAEVLPRILHGARTRLRPVLMTAAVASLGFLPMALSHSPGSEVQRPLATVVIGGLITSTLLTLIVLPVIYYYAEGGKRKKLRTPKPPAGTALGVLLIGLLFSQKAKAQTITLAAALDSASQNHLGVEIAIQERQVAQLREATAWTLPPTQVLGEYGQINSFQTDNKLNLSQGIEFPSVYAADRHLREAYSEQAFARESLTEWDVRREVTMAYYQLLWLMEKQQLLQRADSLYAAFVQRQNERLKAGDTHLLESLAAEARRAEVHHQLLQLQSDLTATQDQLGLLMRSGTRWLPTPQPLKQRGPRFTSGPQASLPAVRLAQASVRIASWERTLERRQRLPSLSAGFTTQTFVGWQTIGSTDTYFDRDRRFSSFSIGLSAPLLLRHNRARSEAAALQMTVAELQTQQVLEQAERERTTLLQQLSTQDSIVLWFESSGLEQARQIQQLADLQLSSGEISYLEWMMLIHQSIQLQSNHLDALHSRNRIIILLDFLHNPTF